jgi:hypothetical protein
VSALHLVDRRLVTIPPLILRASNSVGPWLIGGPPVRRRLLEVQKRLIDIELVLMSRIDVVRGHEVTTRPVMAGATFSRSIGAGRPR